MKKTLSLLLVFALLVTIFPTSIFAATGPESAVIKHDEAVTEDGYKIKVTETTTYINTDVFDPNGQFVDSSRVDLQTGEVTYTTAQGAVEHSNVDDYVQEVPVKLPEKKISNYLAGNAAEQGQVQLNEPSSDVTIQALLNEPVTDDGLATSVYGDGYKFLGSTGVYYFNDQGYLFRKISSMTKDQSHKFTFSAGTAIATIVSVVASVFTGGTWTAAVITSVLITSGGSLIDYFSGSFEYRTYNYLYKVRVFTQPWFETYRNISYWVTYNDATETLRFKQKSFNHGFSMANFEMVKAGIDNYMVANP